jgi:protein-S-isoprenylcysteine O-methyltransferase Ste14
LTGIGAAKCRLPWPPIPKHPAPRAGCFAHLRVFIFVIAIGLLSTTRIPRPWLYLQLWPVGVWPFWLGAAVTIAGLLFAVRAREHLGSNWGRSVPIKQGHELITTGPYAVVRHPI